MTGQNMVNNQTNNNFEFARENRNENEIRQCVIEIEDISVMNNYGNGMNYQMSNTQQTGSQTNQTSHIIPFSYVYKFQKAGKVKVKYSFNNANLTNISYLFYNCFNLVSVDFSNFNSENITNMSHLFDRDEFKAPNINMPNFNIMLFKFNKFKYI
jgi:surface protein